MLLGRITSPRKITDELEPFLQLLPSRSRPRQVKLVAAGGRENDCFANVERRVEKRGGRAQHGWLIQQFDVMYEAIAHSIWVTEDEVNWFDVTPRKWANGQVMFVPDERMVWQEQAIQSIRMNRTPREEVDDMIKVLNAGDRVRGIATYTKGSDKPHFPSTEVAGVDTWFMNWGMSWQLFVGKKFTHAAPCPCTSGKPYQNCCRGRIDLEINVYLSKIGL